MPEKIGEIVLEFFAALFAGVQIVTEFQTGRRDFFHRVIVLALLKQNVLETVVLSVSLALGVLVAVDSEVGVFYGFIVPTITESTVTYACNAFWDLYTFKFFTVEKCGVLDFF